jgi:hypothetical protein
VDHTPCPVLAVRPAAPRSPARPALLESAAST